MSVYDGGDILQPGEPARSFDVGRAGYWRGWNVAAEAQGRVTCVTTEGSLSGGVITFEHSPDGFTWHGFASAVTLSAPGQTPDLDLSVINFLRGRTSSAQAGCKVYLSLVAKRRQSIKG